MEKTRDVSTGWKHHDLRKIQWMKEAARPIPSTSTTQCIQSPCSGHMVDEEHASSAALCFNGKSRMMPRKKGNRPRQPAGWFSNKPSSPHEPMQAMISRAITNQRSVAAATRIILDRIEGVSRRTHCHRGCTRAITC
mmetsp:Transcript_24586/g.68547  ORF Transcript_24586/g.68547 Transcript_24586/m.68547 type:complete len:137 (-) Transcript_24586:129-539(-)